MNTTTQTPTVTSTWQILTTTQITIRPVTASHTDLTTLQAIAAESFTATFAPYNDVRSITEYVVNNYQLPTLQAEVTAPTSATFFLEGNGQPLGYLKLNWGPAQTEPNFPGAIEIQRIYLLPAVWGQGLGHHLMDFALTYARTHHFNQIWLGVWQKNERAQHFYARYGFQPVSTHCFWMGDHEQCDDLLLKELF